MNDQDEEVHQTINNLLSPLPTEGREEKCNESAQGVAAPHGAARPQHGADIAAEFWPYLYEEVVR